MCSRWWACSGSVHAFVGLVTLPALALPPVALGVSGTARRHWCGTGTAPRSASLRSLWSSTRVDRLLWQAFPRLVWWPSHMAKRSHGCWACCSWTSSSCSSVRRLLVVSRRSSLRATSPSLGRRIPKSTPSCQSCGSPLLPTCSVACRSHSVIGPFSARSHEAPCSWQLLFLHLFAVDSLDVLNPRDSSVSKKRRPIHNDCTRTT